MRGETTDQMLARAPGRRRRWLFLAGRIRRAREPEAARHGPDVIDIREIYRRCRRPLPVTMQLRPEPGPGRAS